MDANMDAVMEELDTINQKTAMLEQKKTLGNLLREALLFLLSFSHLCVFPSF